MSLDVARMAWAWHKHSIWFVLVRTLDEDFFVAEGGNLTGLVVFEGVEAVAAFDAPGFCGLWD